MSYTVFARKYRPQTFDDVVGQEHITRTLKNAIELRRLAHAYIFVGPRGTGKTSTARILAKSLNSQSSEGPTIQPCGVCDACKEITGGNSLDVLEFDAASNTQVDKVRELIIDNVKYAPSRGRYKVYIVDEVHMLSTSSFNALLKTLEEPPEHVKFVFATTDVQKVPTTILSRCQRFDLKRIPTPLIAGHLLHIARQEGIALSKAAAETIAHGAEGGMRDAESMLDQLVAFCGNTIEEADVLTIFGLTAQETVTELAERIISAETPGALAMLHEESEAGRDLTRLMSDLISHFRNLLVAQADAGSLRGEQSEEAVGELVAQAGRVRAEKLLELIEQFAGAEARMRWSPNRKMHFEIALIRAVQTLRQATLGEVIETLGALRSGGALPERPVPEPRAQPAEVKRVEKVKSEERPAPAPAPQAKEEPPAPKSAAEKPTPAPLAPVKAEVPASSRQEEPAPAATSRPRKAPAAPVQEAPTQAVAQAAEKVAPAMGIEPEDEEDEEEEPRVRERSASSLVPEPLSAAIASAQPPQVAESKILEQEAEVDVPEPAEEEEPPAEPEPEPESAGPASTSEPSGPVQGELLRHWPELVAEFRRQKPRVAFWVEAGTLLRAGEGVAVLAFPPDQTLAAENCRKPENSALLEELFAQFTGQKLTLQTTVQEGLPPKSSTVQQPATPVDPMESFKDDPLIRKALEIFRAQIQPA